MNKKYTSFHIPSSTLNVKRMSTEYICTYIHPKLHSIYDMNVFTLFLIFFSQIGHIVTSVLHCTQSLWWAHGRIKQLASLTSHIRHLITLRSCSVSALSSSAVWGSAIIKWFSIAYPIVFKTN